MIDIEQEDLFIWLLTQKVSRHDYLIFKEMGDFLESHGVQVREHTGGISRIMGRVITELWSERECESSKTRR